MPFSALKWLISWLNYGGRVTEGEDIRLIETILDDIYCKDIYEQTKYPLSPNAVYYVPKYASKEYHI